MADGHRASPKSGTGIATPSTGRPNRLKPARAEVTRYDKRGYVFLGIATAEAPIIWFQA